MRTPLLFLAALGATLAGCDFVRGYAEGKSEVMAQYAGEKDVGAYRLLFEDFHSVTTDNMQRAALSWKVLTASELRYHREKTDPKLPMTEAAFRDLLTKRYGFLQPERIANLPPGAKQPVMTRPVGLIHGTIRRSIPGIELEVTNTGCATCHASNLFDAEGKPTREVWLGLPSTSIDLGRYADELYPVLKWGANHPDDIVASVKELFPTISETELKTIQKFYLPEVKKRIDELDKTIGRFTPYSNGGAGLTNGVATIQLYFGRFGTDKMRDDMVAFTSIPDFGALKLKSAILWDGVYAPPGWKHFSPLPESLDENTHRNGIAGITSVVTIGTLGDSAEVAATNPPVMRDVVDFIFDHYAPPPFPGKIDEVLAAKGEEVFKARCQTCHGVYEKTSEGYRITKFPNRLIPKDKIGTDPTRADAPGDTPNDMFQPTPMAKYLEAVPTHGYVAPPLTSIWITAPYFHNGSVPTLWHVLHPEARPAKFMVGGHRLDYAKVGIAGEVNSEGVYAYPAGYEPWMLPDTYDTAEPGRHNGGHEKQVEGLDEAEKAAVLEFLKRL